MISSDSATLLKTAQEVHFRGNAAEAAELYQKILSTDPECTEALHYLGIAMHHLGKSSEAVEIIRQSLQREPSEIEWLNNLGNVFCAQGNFDEAAEIFRQVIARQPSDHQGWENLGTIYQRQKRYEEAESAYKHALDLKPGNVQAFYLLAHLMNEQGRMLESGRYHSQGLILDEKEPKSPYDLGKAFLILGKIDEAAELYRQWLKDEPDNPTPAHFLAACTNLNVPPKCSKEYIEATFDAFAATFEQNLHQLQYQVPEWVKKLLAELSLPKNSLDILDAGCGTGLCAEALRPFAKKLAGLDLSQKMLDYAERRKVYDDLIQADICAHLAAHPGTYDLVLAADMLIYLGDLQELFKEIVTALRPGGHFIFTIEHLPATSGAQFYKLNPTGRYCHTTDYVQSLCEKHHLSSVKTWPGPLRMELGHMVDGFVCAVKKG